MASVACNIWWNRSNNTYYLRLWSVYNVWFYRLFRFHILYFYPNSRPYVIDPMVFVSLLVNTQMQFFTRYFSVVSVFIRPTWIALQHSAPNLCLKSISFFMRMVPMDTIGWRAMGLGLGSSPPLREQNCVHSHHTFDCCHTLKLS